MKRWLILLSVGCLAFAGVANASVQQGDTEVELQGQFIDISGDYQLSLNAGLGYFVTDALQLGGVVVGQWVEDGTDQYGFMARGRYHFMTTNQCVPFVGAFAGITWTDSDSEFTYGPVAGLRYELNEWNDLGFEYQYQLYESADTDGQHNIVFGIIHQFK